MVVVVAALSVRDLWVSGGDGHRVEPVSGVSFDVAVGSLTCLSGGEGSGAGTVVDVITGRTPPTSGELRLHGVDLTGPAAGDRWVTVVGPDVPVVPHLTVEEVLTLVPPPHQRPPRGRVSTVLERLRIPDAARHRTAALPRGQHLLVALARALLREPALVVLDLDRPGPAAGRGGTEGLEWVGVRDAAHLDGRTILVVTAEPPVPVDRTLTMAGGALVADVAGGPSAPA